MSILHWRRARVVVLALIAGAAITAAVGYASVPDTNGVIHTCYNVNGRGEIGANAALRVIDPSSPVRAGRACTGGEAPLDFPDGVGQTYSVHTTGDVTIGSNSFVPVETLNVPVAGSYFFLATVSMALTVVDPTEDVTSTCEVVFSAGALSDTIDGFVRSNLDKPGNTTMQTLETFPEAGTATLQCNGLTAFAFNARITAVPVSAFTDTAAS